MYRTEGVTERTNDQTTLCRLGLMAKPVLSLSLCFHEQLDLLLSPNNWVYLVHYLITFKSIRVDLCQSVCVLCTLLFVSFFIRLSRY